MRRLTADDYIVMPWKNGAGATTQLAVSPAGAGLNDFDWRISTALVGSDGPFSAFPGVDRSLAVLRGSGLVLLSEDAEYCRLSQGVEPFVFAGEEPIAARLESGPVTDFNVMTRRSSCAHLLEMKVIQDKLRCVPRSDLTLIHVVRGGRVTCHDAGGAIEWCSEGDTLVIDWRDGSEVDLTVQQPTALCLAHITYKESHHD